MWLFYVVRYGETWSTSRIQAKVSRDGAETWSDAFMLHDRQGMMVRNRPIVLDDGDYLLPIYHETGDDTESVGADSTSLFLRYDPQTGRGRRPARSLAEGQHPAGGRRSRAGRPDRLLPSRRRLRARTPTAASCAPSRATAAGPGREGAIRPSPTRTRRSTS